MNCRAYRAAEQGLMACHVCGLLVHRPPSALPPLLDSVTRAILRDLDGNEQFLSEQELRRIAEEEAAKVEAGTSNLTQEQSMRSGGLSLGETLQAAAAGSLIGGMLANRLMGNRNFQRTQQRYGGGRILDDMSKFADHIITPKQIGSNS